MNAWVWPPIVARAAPSPSAAGGGAYLGPPAVPNAFNDEFSSGSANLAERGGWTFRRVTATAGDMAWVGPISGNRALDPALGPLEYKASIVDGKWCVQLPLGGVTYSLTKPVAVPVDTQHGAILFARSMTGFGAATGTHLAQIEMGFFKDLLGVADLDHCVMMGQFNTAANAMIRDGFWDTTHTPHDQALGYPRANIYPDLKVLTIFATGATFNYQADFASSSDGAYSFFGAGSPSGLGSAAGLVHAGYMLNPGPSSTISQRVPFDFALGFARLYTGDLQGKWIGDPALSS